MKRLTKDQKSHAQFLHITWSNAVKISDRLDPGRKQVNVYDNIASLASQGFFNLTGQLPGSVELTDLNTTKTETAESICKEARSFWTGQYFE